jgi:NAD(P)H-flavin reductase
MVSAIGELEAIRLVSANLRMGRVSTIGSPAMVAAVISQLQLVSVNLRIGRVTSIGPRAMVAAVISELEARHFV